MTETIGTNADERDGACCGSCGTDGAAATDERAEGVTVTYAVVGMTCGHCVNAVTEEISKINGVRAVHVDLGTGRVEVTADAVPAEADVAAAVDEAGYELTATA